MAKPALAAWIQRERKREKRPDGKPRSTADLSARLALMGVQASDQTIRVWEGNSGRRPGPEAIDALERIFGSAAPGRAEGDQGTAAVVSAINAAIDRQTEAIVKALAGRDQSIEALLKELGSYRQQQQGLVETVVAALEQSRSGAR